MERASSLRHVLRTLLTWSCPIAILYGLMLAPNWAWNLASPPFDLQNPQRP